VPDIRLTVDGEPSVVPAGQTAGDVFQERGIGGAIAVRANEEDVHDLNWVPEDGDAIESIPLDTEEGRAILRHSTAHVMAQAVTDLFPEAGSVEGAEFWTGLRPMTPDGTPLLGATPMPNLLLATGHGTLGWTMATGTGQLMADWIGGHRPAIDTEGLTIARY